jgi:hypothetical protein
MKANTDMTSTRIATWPGRVGPSGVQRSNGALVGPHGTRNDAGAVLILALVFLVSVSTIIATLAGWAINDLNDTTHFSSGFALQNAAGSATEVAIQYVRYSSTPLVEGTQPSAISCLGAKGTPASVTFTNGPNSDPTYFTNTMAVWCNTDWEPTSSTTRTVTFWACESPVGGTTASACQANPILEAVVVFDDYPSSLSAPIDGQCNVWCGSGMAVTAWDWKK